MPWQQQGLEPESVLRGDLLKALIPILNANVDQELLEGLGGGGKEVRQGPCPGKAGVLADGGQTVSYRNNKEV